MLQPTGLESLNGDCVSELERSYTDGTAWWCREKLQSTRLLKHASDLACICVSQFTSAIKALLQKTCAVLASVYKCRDAFKKWTKMNIHHICITASKMHIWDKRPDMCLVTLQVMLALCCTKQSPHSTEFTSWRANTHCTEQDTGVSW